LQLIAVRHQTSGVARRGLLHLGDDVRTGPEIPRLNHHRQPASSNTQLIHSAHRSSECEVRIGHENVRVPTLAVLAQAAHRISIARPLHLNVR
jgi:hypothetical protein